MTISNLHFDSPFAHQAVQNDLENGKQRKVTAVILGSELAPCSVGSKEIGSEGVGARD